MIGGQSVGGGDLLPLGGGAALFFGYVVVIGVGAHLVTLRRDVT